MILTAVEIANPDFSYQTYQIYLLMLALLLVDGILTTTTTKFVGHFNIAGTIINMAVLVIFVVWMPAGSINTPKMNSNEFVWTEVVNGTEWPAGLAFLMGFLSVIWTLRCNHPRLEKKSSSLVLTFDQWI